jgi:hypothetical protein
MWNIAALTNVEDYFVNGLPYIFHVRLSPPIDTSPILVYADKRLEDRGGRSTVLLQRSHLLVILMLEQEMKLLRNGQKDPELQCVLKLMEGLFVKLFIGYQEM